MKVFIDPGHRNNKNDFGASGNGLNESALALSISKKLKSELEKHNIIVYMSRETEEEYPSLPTRTKKANTLDVDLYLSVHINAASNNDAAGIEVLYYDEQLFAQDMCNKMCIHTNAKNRGAKKRTDLHVLTATTMSSLLVECGFISNLQEAKLMADYNYQDKIVKGIAEAIISKYKIVVEDTDEYKKAVTKLSQGININDAAWYPIQKVNLKNVPELLRKMGGIDKLYTDGVIGNKLLWEEGEYKVNHVRSLIIKYAARLG